MTSNRDRDLYIHYQELNELFRDYIDDAKLLVIESMYKIYSIKYFQYMSLTDHDLYKYIPMYDWSGTRNYEVFVKRLEGLIEAYPPKIKTLEDLINRKRIHVELYKDCRTYVSVIANTRMFYSAMCPYSNLKKIKELISDKNRKLYKQLVKTSKELKFKRFLLMLKNRNLSCDLILNIHVYRYNIDSSLYNKLAYIIGNL